MSECVNERARTIVIGNLRESQKKYNKMFEEGICKMQQATTENQLMLAKQKLLSRIVSSIPLNERSCYFCMKHDAPSYGVPFGNRIGYFSSVGKCGNCEYKEGREVCGNLNSSYQRIQGEKDNLIKIINEEYWTDTDECRSDIPYVMVRMPRSGWYERYMIGDWMEPRRVSGLPHFHVESENIGEKTFSVNATVALRNPDDEVEESKVKIDMEDNDKLIETLKEEEIDFCIKEGQIVLNKSDFEELLDI